MNWDCTLFMRTSLDDKLPFQLKFPPNKINAAVQTLQNPIIDSKKPLKTKNKQSDKSRELKKKMSLKSKSNSMNKRYQPQQEFKENLFNQLQNFYAPTARPGPDKSQKQSRLRTESSYSNTANTYMESIPFYKGNCTQRQLEFFPPCLNSPTFKTTVKKSISLNNTQYNQQNLGHPQLKITPFCQTRISTAESCNKNGFTVNQFKNFKPMVKITNHEIKESFKRVESNLTVKNVVFVNGRQATHKNIEKEIPKSQKEHLPYNCVQGTKTQKHLQQSQKESKKQKIQDFLNSKQLTKSVRDSGELSQESQCSRVVITYGEILKEHGKFHLDS